MLPIGSIVRLQDGEQLLMIISRKPIIEKELEEVYLDYIACNYPSGILDEETYFFNHEDIAEIIFYGYRGKEEKELTDYLNEWESLTPLRKGVVNNSLGID